MGVSCGSWWSPGACYRHPNPKPRFPHPPGLDAPDTTLPFPRPGCHTSRKRKLVGQAEVPRISPAESGLRSQHVFGVFWTPSFLPLQSMQGVVLNTLSRALPARIHVQPASSCSCLPRQLSFLDVAHYWDSDKEDSNSGHKSRHYALSLRAQTWKTLPTTAQDSGGSPQGNPCPQDT